MKINWKVRVKNPYFWIGLVAMFFCAIGIDASTLTSWDALVDSLKGLISNPYLLGTVIVALFGYVIDPTTAGFGDSTTALGYRKPKKEMAGE
jgi:phi LC3 family holin